MTKKGATILIGEDDCEVRGYLEMAVRCMGYEVILAEDGDEVLSFLEKKNSVSAVLLDITMPRRDGLETLRDIRKLNLSLPVVMVSDASSPSNVIQSIKLGATDFLGKPVAHQQLRDVIAKVIGNSPDAAVEDEAQGNGTPGKVFYGFNPRMREIKRMLRDIALAEAPVLIRGETGVGKEMIAREIHALSPRARKPLLKLNCAAVPSELVESELFGYERGAFTGAFQRKSGMFELAHGGTLMLDEIGDMKFELQAKLLQVLQDQEFQRIGGKDTIRVDVHIIAATHQNLEDAIANKEFREDLYYRLNVISLEIPALRHRKEDIIPLAQFLLDKRNTGESVQLASALKRALSEYDWPGNIRELENVLRRFLILKDENAIIRELQSKMARRGVHSVPISLPEPSSPQTSKMAPTVPVSPNASVSDGPILARVSKLKQEAEIAAILNALNRTRWNRKQAAALLKIDYKALLYKMKTLGISGDSWGDSAATPDSAMPPVGDQVSAAQKA